MTLVDIILLIVVFAAAIIVLGVWLRDVFHWFYLRSEESRRQFIRELCWSLRNDKDWKHKGSRWERGGLEFTMCAIDGNEYLRILHPFDAKCHEFSDEEHELVRYAIRARLKQCES